MIVAELSTAQPQRVQWLCGTSSDAAIRLCSDADAAHPATVHCACFAVHIAASVALPDAYAWEVLRSPKYAEGLDVFRAPLEGHVCTMAMYAADLDAAAADLLDFCSCHNPELRRAAVLRFAHSQKALDDDRLLELSYSNEEAVCAAVARVLEWRKSPHRNEILTRLTNDSNRLVSIAAATVAGRIKDPGLLDLLAAKGHLYSLSMAGDPRGRPCAEALVSSDDPLGWEQGVGMALRLEDRDLLTGLWRHHDWDTRSHAILGAAWRRLIDTAQLDDVALREDADHLTELLLRWPHNDNEALLKIARVLRDSVEGFPSDDALAEGRASALDRVRAWVTANPRLSAAMTRLIPNDTAVQLTMDMLASPEADARNAAVEAVARRGLSECFPRVAELCLDPEKTVAKTAADAVVRGRIRCGLYGLDTAILRAGDDFSASISQRQRLGSLVERILTADA